MRSPLAVDGGLAVAVSRGLAVATGGGLAAEASGGSELSPGMEMGVGVRVGRRIGVALKAAGAATALTGVRVRGETVTAGSEAMAAGFELAVGVRVGKRVRMVTRLDTEREPVSAEPQANMIRVKTTIAAQKGNRRCQAEPGKLGAFGFNCLGALLPRCIIEITD
jgi:hypothetical protein